MHATIIAELPPLPDQDIDDIYVNISDTAGVLFTRTFIARINLSTCRLDWLVKRSQPVYQPHVWTLPRRVSVSGKSVWVNSNQSIIAEIFGDGAGGLSVEARSSLQGKLLWERTIPPPEAAQWAEKTPAWHGAQTEEIAAFIGDDPNCLVICFFRQSRRAMRFDPSEGINATSLPPYTCQLDACCLDIQTGAIQWGASFSDVKIGILERRRFCGLWSNGARAGHIDFARGVNSLFYESNGVLGQPIYQSGRIAIPWHSSREIGVLWMDAHGKVANQFSTSVKGVRATTLHSTEAGLALQTNDQGLWWLGLEESPRWQTRAKPYVYSVHRSPNTDVYVGTAGGGGRLRSYDESSGMENMNLKPKYGGAGNTLLLQGQSILFSQFWTSRTNSAACQLIEISMTDRKHVPGIACSQLLGVWAHGAICRTGRAEEQLAVVFATRFSNE